jgi:hypothetical protein
MIGSLAITRHTDLIQSKIECPVYSQHSLIVSYLQILFRMRLGHTHGSTDFREFIIFRAN